MENFDRENIDELLEIRQIRHYFPPVKNLRRTVDLKLHDHTIIIIIKIKIIYDWIYENRSYSYVCAIIEMFLKYSVEIHYKLNMFRAAIILYVCISLLL